MSDGALELWVGSLLPPGIAGLVIVGLVRRFLSSHEEKLAGLVLEMKAIALEMHSQQTAVALTKAAHDRTEREVERLRERVERQDALLSTIATKLELSWPHRRRIVEPEEDR